MQVAVVGTRKFRKSARASSPPQVSEVIAFMAKKAGKVVHTSSSRRYLVGREFQTLDWCSSCGSGKGNKMT